MTRHPFDPTSFVLGLLTVVVAVVGLVLALGDVSLEALRFLGPLVLAGLGVVALLTATRRGEPDTADDSPPAVDATPGTGLDTGGER